MTKSLTRSTRGKPSLSQLTVCGSPGHPGREALAVGVPCGGGSERQLLPHISGDHDGDRAFLETEPGNTNLKTSSQRPTSQARLCQLKIPQSLQTKPSMGDQLFKHKSWWQGRGTVHIQTVSSDYSNSPPMHLPTHRQQSPVGNSSCLYPSRGQLYYIHSKNKQQPLWQSSLGVDVTVPNI